jgi:acylphosphatase
VQDDWKHMYGYGIEFAVDGAGKIMFAQKEGHNTGVSAVIRHYPDQDINVVILANIQNSAWEPLRKIHGLLKVG